MVLWAQDSWDALQAEKRKKKINMNTYKSSSNPRAHAMPSSMLS